MTRRQAEAIAREMFEGHEVVLRSIPRTYSKQAGCAVKVDNEIVGLGWTWGDALVDAGMSLEMIEKGGK